MTMTKYCRLVLFVFSVLNKGLNCDVFFFTSHGEWYTIHGEWRPQKTILKFIDP